MKIRSRYIIYLLFFLILFFSLYFFSSGERLYINENPGKLRVWMFGNEGELIGPLLEEFERRHPKTEVILEKFDWDSKKVHRLGELPEEDLPDVCHFGTTWMAEHIYKNNLLNLSWFFNRQRATRIKKEDFYAETWESCKLQRNVYGIPWYIDVRLLYYNRDILEKAGFTSPPETWKEMFVYCKKLKEIYPEEGDFYPLALPFDNWDVPLMLLYSSGVDLFPITAEKPEITSPKAVKTLELYREFFKHGYSASKSPGANYNVEEELKNQRLAMTFAGTWLARKLEKQDTINWGVTTIPTNSDKEPGISFLGGGTLVIPRQAQNHLLAWELIKFLTSVPNQRHVFKKMGDLPARKIKWDKKMPDWYRAAGKQIMHTKQPPNIPQWKKISGVLAQTVESIVIRQGNVKEELIKLNNKNKKILKKSN